MPANRSSKADWNTNGGLGGTSAEERVYSGEQVKD